MIELGRSHPAAEAEKVSTRDSSENDGERNHKQKQARRVRGCVGRSLR